MASQLFGGRPIDDEYYHILCYYHPNNKKVIASNLWANGMGIFKRATIIERYDEYRVIPANKQQMPTLDKIAPFIFESIMDKTRIITCFENFMKGSLLLSDFVVHEISEYYSVLKKKQKKQPIKVAELFTPSSFIDIDKRNPQSLETIDKTIGFGRLVSQNYQDVLHLPKEILTGLTNLNKERNRLHFMEAINFEHSQYLIDLYFELKNFVDTIMMPSFLKLQENLDQIKEDLNTNDKLKSYWEA